MADKKKYGPLNQIIGNVGQDPEEFPTRVGPVVRFSVARPLGYGDDAPPPRWVSVAVFNEEIREQVLDQIHKGSRVAVEGTITESEYEGKPQYNMKASRVGLVDWFLRTRQDETPAPRRKASSKAKARDDDDDDDDDDDQEDGDGLEW